MVSRTSDITAQCSRTFSRFTSFALVCGLAGAIGIAGFLSVGCQSVGVSNRRQLVIIPEQQEIQMGEESYRQILAEEKLSENEEAVEVVRRVGNRIAAVSGRPDFQWEFNLIESGQTNAFALPGGKVAVHEGILDVCQNEAGLAVVMSHEVAHALARHGGERMSHQAVVNAGNGVLQRVMRNKDAEKRERLMHAYGIGTKYGVVLPYSRDHEMEADSIGLSLMAKAGYDPREAPKFWERFGAMGGSKPPEFLSTHPSDKSRAHNLTNLLPQALALYEATEHQYGTGISLNTALSPRSSADVENLSKLKMVAFAEPEPPTSTSTEPTVKPEAAAFPETLSATPSSPTASLIEQVSFTTEENKEEFLQPLSRAKLIDDAASPPIPTSTDGGVMTPQHGQEPLPFPGTGAKPIESTSQPFPSDNWVPTQQP